ncbi:unnamed protein product [Blepharisma stoltei]|uniref:coproporphyrinogen oxidase n=1 Tax=Blepharisma stoltei TaxID=1481888 RepID=A0AAU9IVG9_9CILI|nr:unnamed protein product [Blepharisma stoltei]
MADTSFRAKAKETIQEIQKKITESLEIIEGSPFVHDSWERHDHNGHGQANVIQNGRVFEKGGINFTELEIPLSLNLAKYITERGKNIDLSRVADYLIYAASCSLVIHPRNPHCPTVHANYRYLEVTLNGEAQVWWFAGGSDLTPYYLDEADCVLFHTEHKNACDFASPDFYPQFKIECDNYFNIAHRGFRRGIGGIFFDDLDCLDKETLREFVSKCGDAFVRSYPEIVKKHMNEPYNKDQRRWQKIRRGHYVEFNLVYDRGTKFGLVTPDANIEAILMPCPLSARWEYKHTLAPGSAEERLMSVLITPRDWII